LVTHLQPASPPDKPLEFHSYLVSVSASDPQLFPESFIEMPNGPSYGVAVGRRFAFVTGFTARRFDPPAPLIRLVERTPPHRVLQTVLEQDYRVLDGRGITLSADERRAYVVGHNPNPAVSGSHLADSLVVLGIEGFDPPNLRVVHATPLPLGANEVEVVPREGRGDLVIVSCAIANRVAVYDDDLGGLVAEIEGVGLEPFGLAVHRRVSPQGTTGARIFVSNTGDGRVAVIDMADLNRPQEVQVVAHLGRLQEGGDQ
jgi:hypothetical protein